MGDLVCRHNDYGRCDGDRPVFVGTMTVGDLVMVNCVCRHNDCGRSCDGYLCL